MTTAIAFVCLAATGAIGRGAIGQRLNIHHGLPFGTLVVNLTSSFALGLLHSATAPVHTALGVGMLGAYTTFSSFARDGVALVEQRKAASAAVYVTISLSGAIGGAALGIALAP